MKSTCCSTFGVLAPKHSLKYTSHILYNILFSKHKDNFFAIKNFSDMCLLHFLWFMACRFLGFMVTCNMTIFAAQLTYAKNLISFLFLFSASYACHSTQESLCPANRRWQIHTFEPQTVLWQFTYQVTPPKTPRRCQEVS